MSACWRPSATIEALQHRAEILHTIRSFFRQRNVLEVETPLLADATVSDPHIHSIALDYNGIRYLQTSPEQHMKRLLCAGSGDIFQLCKAFRKDESGKLHNPEFTMLEWYRLNYSITQLAEETCQLIHQICPHIPAQYSQTTYSDVFARYLDCHPLEVKSTTLRALLPDTDSAKLTDEDAIDLLFSHYIEPQLGKDTLQVVRDFPVWQASLAQVHKNQRGEETANRFEVYWHGTELANGYLELRESHLLHSRYQADCQKRIQADSPAVPYMQRLHEAMEHGLTPCAGVALGVDRLVMIALGATTIADVVSFPFDDS